MVTKVFHTGTYHNIKPDESIKTFRRLRSFCIVNGLPTNVFREQGGYYMIKKNGEVKHLFYALNEISFQQFFNIAKKELR